MKLKLKRAANAFLLGFIGTGLALLLDNWQNINNAVVVGDWQQLKFLILPVIGGAIGAGIRALQSNIAQVPSPESSENV